jgi:phosphopantetheinyl transferase
LTSEKKLTNIFSLNLNREEEYSTASLCLAKMPLSALAESVIDWIHPKEQATLERLTFQRRKASYLLGRYCAKQAIQQQYTALPLNHICIGEGVFHQPILYGSEINAIQVSIAHTHDLGAALVFDERHPMGIDIELNNDNHTATIISELTSFEQCLLSNQWPFSSKIQPYPWIWTVKEALGKALKTGLTVPMPVYEIKEVVHEGDFIMSTYKNFPQYKSLSFLWNETIVSIVLPRKTAMNLILKS